MQKATTPHPSIFFAVVCWAFAERQPEMEWGTQMCICIQMPL